MAYNFFIEKTDSQYLLSIKTKSPPSRYYRKKTRRRALPQNIFLSEIIAYHCIDAVSLPVLTIQIGTVAIKIFDTYAAIGREVVKGIPHDILGIAIGFGRQGSLFAVYPALAVRGRDKEFG